MGLGGGIAAELFRVMGADPAVLDLFDKDGISYVIHRP